MLAAAVLFLLLGATISEVLGIGEPGQVPFTVALFVLPLLYVFPVPRRVLASRRWLVLAGLVLLMAAGWASWLLAGRLLMAEFAVRAVVTGLPSRRPGLASWP